MTWFGLVWSATPVRYYLSIGDGAWVSLATFVVPTANTSQDHSRAPQACIWGPPIRPQLWTRVLQALLRSAARIVSLRFWNWGLYGLDVMPVTQATASELWNRDFSMNIPGNSWSENSKIVFLVVMLLCRCLKSCSQIGGSWQDSWTS